MMLFLKNNVTNGSLLINKLIDILSHIRIKISSDYVIYRTQAPT